MTLQELITASIQENGAAQQKLFNMYYQRSLIYCILHVKDRHDAEDVAMIGFHQFFKKLPHFEYNGSHSVFNWLRVILRNECNKLRRNKNSYWNFTAISESIDVPAPDSTVLDKLNAADILSIIHVLKKEQLAIFTAYELDGMTHREIAEEFGITENSSRVTLNRAKNEIQSLLNKKSYSYEK